MSLEYRKVTVASKVHSEYFTIGELYDCIVESHDCNLRLLAKDDHGFLRVVATASSYKELLFDDYLESKFELIKVEF